MSESQEQNDESTSTNANAETDTGTETGNVHECRRCGREEGLVSRYDIYLCRQCFREVARSMGAKKYN